MGSGTGYALSGFVAQPRILVLDDENLIRWSLARILSRQGFEVDAAACRDEALALARSRRYDLILADFEVCGPDEGVFLAALVAGPERRKLIILTAMAPDKVEAALGGCEAFRILEKPFSSEDIAREAKCALTSGGGDPTPGPARPPEGGPR